MCQELTDVWRMVCCQLVLASISLYFSFVPAFSIELELWLSHASGRRIHGGQSIDWRAE